MKVSKEERRSEEEIARRRDETIRNMFATPPQRHKDMPKKRAKAQPQHEKKPPVGR